MSMNKLTNGLNQGVKSMNSFLLSFDRFSEPIKLNFNKRASIPSLVGFLMTLLCYSVVFVYGFQRVQKFVYR